MSVREYLRCYWDVFRGSTYRMGVIESAWWALKTTRHALTTDAHLRHEPDCPIRPCLCDPMNGALHLYDGTSGGEGVS